MSATTVSISVPTFDPAAANRNYNFPVAAATLIPCGVIVAINGSGKAVNASDAASLQVIGRSLQHVDNSAGAAGDKTVQVENAYPKYANDGTHPVAVGEICYVKDNQTVVGAAGSTHKIPCGVAWSVESDGVFVDQSAAALAFAVVSAGLANVTQTQDTLTDSSTGTASTTLAAMTGVDGTGSNAAPLTATKNAIATLAAQLAKVKVDIAAIKTAAV